MKNKTKIPVAYGRMDNDGDESLPRKVSKTKKIVKKVMKSKVDSKGYSRMA